MKKEFIEKFLSGLNLSKFYHPIFLFFLSLIFFCTLYLSLAPSKIYAACQCAYPEICTAADGSMGRRTCWGIISGSSCVYDTSQNICNPSPLCDTCISNNDTPSTGSHCICTYSEDGSFCSSAGSGAIHYCWGNDIGAGKCGYATNPLTGCNPGCNACLVVSTPTATPATSATPTSTPATSAAPSATPTTGGGGGVGGGGVGGGTGTVINLGSPSNAVSGVGITVSSVVSFIFNFLIAIGIVAALIYLLYGGIRWITSQGDKAAVESARNHIVAAIIGLLVLVLSWVIVSVVLTVLGLGSLGPNLIIPTLQGT